MQALKGEIPIRVGQSTTGFGIFKCDFQYSGSQVADLLSLPIIRLGLMKVQGSFSFDKWFFDPL